MVVQPTPTDLHITIPYNQYQLIEKGKFILKFKLEYPTQIIDGPSIEIQPQSTSGPTVTNYKTFFVYPLIKIIYPTSSTIESKEVFAYSTFESLSDDGESVPTFFDGLGSIITDILSLIRIDNNWFNGFTKCSESFKSNNIISPTPLPPIPPLPQLSPLSPPSHPNNQIQLHIISKRNIQKVVKLN
ncbi:hypothetical protein ACTA71_000624 [Dictyostelium dimigraforme]